VCAALVGGECDMNSGPVFWDSMTSAVQQGLCSSDDVDRALANTLRLRFQLGLFDPIDNQPCVVMRRPVLLGWLVRLTSLAGLRRYWHVPPSAVGAPASKALSLLGARQGIVLLKNDDQLLPLSPGLRLAVVGPNANNSANLLGNCTQSHLHVPSLRHVLLSHTRIAPRPR